VRACCERALLCAHTEHVCTHLKKQNSGDAAHMLCDAHGRDKYSSVGIQSDGGGRFPGPLRSAKPCILPHLLPYFQPPSPPPPRASVGGVAQALQLLPRPFFHPARPPSAPHPLPSPTGEAGYVLCGGGRLPAWLCVSSRVWQEEEEEKEELGRMFRYDKPWCVRRTCSRHPIFR
jgi:hypothetical protein